MSPRPDVSAQRIPQILQAAAIVFAQKGMGRTTMSDIADEAKLSKALLYKYFENKENLILALCTSIFSQLSLPDRKEEQLCSVALKEWADNCGREIAAARNYIGLGFELVALVRSDENVRLVIRKAYADYAKALEDVILLGIKNGEFNPGDAAVLARSVIAQFEGLNLIWFVEPEKFSLQKSYGQAMDVMLNGIISAS
ncbi:MAG: TetR/AcrR family transcriptional regulator [Devosiaceae bacterium]|nr:TetR/AcrR family transcriptional regulator [Devosiaceae bacterium]